MIHFNLRCADGHEFEGWFRNSDAFDRQAEKKQIVCPVCSGTKVSKALMAPAVTAKGGGPRTDEAVKVRKTLQALRDHVERNCDDVGDKFADEARKIHYGEVESRGIYGQSTDEETRDLVDEGVPVKRIPWIKRADG